jgi:hypothetical protein
MESEDFSVTPVCADVLWDDCATFLMSTVQNISPTVSHKALQKPRKSFTMEDPKGMDK